MLQVRYEDLKANYPFEFKRLVDHLHLEIEQDQRERVFDKYRPEKGDPGRIGTHFSKGEAERYRSVFSPSQLEQFTAMFKDDLPSMGYTP